jgi:two-component system, chemotaxis family, chemotaxis protein CheY
MKCLIIDDDEFNRDYVKTLLGDTAECDEACNGREAVTKFASGMESDNPYDLVILDIMMPDISGHETARSMRAIEKEQGVEVGKRVNIVMLTALNSPQDAMESFCSAQSAAYLVKPVSKEKMSGVISKLGLNRKRQ